MKKVIYTLFLCLAFGFGFISGGSSLNQAVERSVSHDDSEYVLESEHIEKIRFMRQFSQVFIEDEGLSVDFESDTPEGPLRDLDYLYSLAELFSIDNIDERIQKIQEQELVKNQEQELDFRSIDAQRVATLDQLFDHVSMYE